MTSVQLPTNAPRNAPQDQLQHAAAYGRTAVVYGVDVYTPRFGEVGVGAQWTACQAEAHAEGFHIPESSNFLFGEEGVNGRASRRPQLERLLDVVRSGHAQFSRLYVTDVARLSREEDGFSLLQWFEIELASYGIELRVVAGESTFIDVDAFPAALAGVPGRRTRRR